MITPSPILPALAPCPFCGVDPTSRRCMGNGNTWDIRCEEDECGYAALSGFTEEDAIAQWNSRRPAPGEGKPTAGLDLEAIEAKLPGQVQLGVGADPYDVGCLIGEVRRLRSIHGVPPLAAQSNVGTPPAPLVWTKEKPTEGGWFWRRMIIAATGGACSGSSILLVSMDEDYVEVSDPYAWEWAGPIPQPSPTKGATP